MKTYVLPCTSSNPDYNADCDVTIVELDVAKMKLIAVRHELVKEMHARDKNFWEAYFWAGEVDFYTADWVGDDAYLVTDARPVPELDEPQRVECLQMVIDAEGHVRWTCIPKHTSIYITTENLPL